MAGRIFVTGGSGFVGSSVIEELLSRNYSVNALAHGRDLQVTGDRVRVVRGDVFDASALDDGLRGCDGAIHLVGIIMQRPSKGLTFERMHVEATRSVLEAASRNGVRRYAHMSALGTRPDAKSDYHKTKYRAEQIVRESGLDWTILRPSLIHGPRGDFMRLEARWARRSAPPFIAMPYFGAGPLGLGGAGKLQPVYVKDVARAFVDCLENPKTIGQAYEIAGAEHLTWPHLHQKSSAAIVGKERAVIPMPVWAAKFYASIGLGRLLGFNRDQIIMSQEDNTADLHKFIEDFGWKPQAFTPTLRAYASAL